MADVTQGIDGIGDIAAKLQSGTAGSASSALDVGSLLGQMSVTTMAISLFAGIVGSAYFMYGKRTCNMKILCSGVALCVVPCFITNTLGLVAACIAMAVAPFVI
jgi:4-hydroxybenzoate polyprenyltransferase